MRNAAIRRIALYMGILSLVPAAGGAVGDAGTPPAVTARPLVVLIHGRDQGKAKLEDVRLHFVSGLQNGLKNSGFPNLIGPNDVKFVWYGDIYAEDGIDRTCAYVTIKTQDELAQTNSEAGDVRRWLLAAVSAVPGLVQALANIFVRDTEQYLSRDEYRCATDQRLTSVLNAAAKDGRPVVLVAHSMGSLVSYSALRAMQTNGVRLDVREFVTIGSPLAATEVLRMLAGSHLAPPVAEPISIRHWTNYIAKGDAIAISQAGFFKATDRSRLPTDRHVDNGKQSPHSAALYLGQKTVATTIAKAWCLAVAAPGRPAVCGKAIAAP